MIELDAHCKIYVLDTNVLLHDPSSISSFQDNHVVITLAVLEELDTFKTSRGELGANARRVVHILDDARQRGDITHGVSIGDDGTLSVIDSLHDPDFTGTLKDSVDNELLETTFVLSKKHKSILVTKDINLRIKADVLKIHAEDYTTDKKNAVYPGYDRIQISPEIIAELREWGRAKADLDYPINEFLHLTPEDGSSCEVTLARVTEEGLQLVEWQNMPIIGITAKNLEQHFLFDALLDEEIKLVTIHGKAGTGKTLLSIAAALYKVFVDYAYVKVKLIRPVIPVDKGIGFLPGDIKEKMAPWMAPIYDNLDFIKQEDRKTGRSVLPINFEENDLLEITPLSFIRGQSVSNNIIIVDEAQNLSPLDIKTIVTRAGQDTKLVFTGDIDQIDHPYLSRMDNGLTYLASKFRGNPLHCHMTLTKGERSELAEYATNLL